MRNKREKTIIIAFGLFLFVMLALTLRGIRGNPSSADLNTPQWKEDGPLELSPERGRYALTYSLLEDHSFEYSLAIARFTAPDVAYLNGKYVSLFAPGVSFVMMPGYYIGRYVHLAQVGASAMIALFALINALLIVKISRRLGASLSAAILGASVFLFASPALTYGVTLYQHHISTFLILSAAYLLVAFESAWATAGVWFLAALSLSVDYPNFFMMFPIGLAALGRCIATRKGEHGINIYINFKHLLALGGVILPMLFFFWFNYASYGNPFQLAGTLKQATAIDENGQPLGADLAHVFQIQNKKQAQQLVDVATDKGASAPVTEKTAISFFKTRSILNGFYIHLISPDRGMLWYTPVLLFGIIGFVLLYRKHPRVTNLLVAILGVNVLLYSMWGDPYGGWAFGSRYLIPSYALLGIGIAAMLSHFRKQYLLIALFTIVLSYSVWVNILGAITSSRNPPQIEVLTLEKLSNHEEKYTYERNLQYLHEGSSKSFLFGAYFSHIVTADQYYEFLVALVLAEMLLGLGYLSFGKQEQLE